MCSGRTSMQLSGAHHSSHDGSRHSGPGLATLAVAHGCMLFGAASLAMANDRFEPVRGFIRAAMLEHSVPSIAVAVAQQGRIVWEEGFGWADRERRIAATEHTVYSLASITKPITTTAMMVLVQQGRLNLDAPVNDYLGVAKLRARVGNERDATVRRLADHTAGLPSYQNYYYQDEPYPVPSMDESIARYANIVTEPGESYQYSNLGYGIIDYIIERIAEKPYAQFMRDEVFIPLGLTRTAIGIGPGLDEYAATRYGGNGAPIPYYDFDHRGASAAFSSAHDLVRFAMFHLQTPQPDQSRILSNAIIDEMHRPTSRRETGGGYGLGFETDDRDGHRMVSHGGSMNGVSTVMKMIPEKKIAVVVLSNSGSGLPESIADHIMSRLLPRWTVAAPRKWEPPGESFETPPVLLGIWTGVLVTRLKEVPLELHFKAGGDVHARVGDQFGLVRQLSFEGGHFSGRLAAARLGVPEADRDGARLDFSLRLRGDVLNGSVSSVGHFAPRLRHVLPYWAELSKR